MSPSETRIRSVIDGCVNALVESLTGKLGEKLESVFIAGSYATGTYSLQCPNVNLYLVSKPNRSAELFLPVGNILYDTKKRFSKDINLMADLKPYRFAIYQPEKGKVTLAIRMNLFDMRDHDKNFMVPDYVLRGWIHSEKVLYGSDVLKELRIRVSKDPMILNQKRFVLLTIMQQLKHVPLSYDWTAEPELLFHESYEYAKYSLSEGLILRMNEKEIEQGLDVEIYENKEKYIGFYSERYGQEAATLAKKTLDARDHYAEWKNDVAKATEMYGVAWRIWAVVWGALQQIHPSP